MGFLCLTSFSMFWVCFSCFYKCIGVIMILSNVLLVQGFALSWWLFIVWELVFLTLLLMFIWCLGSMHYFMIVVVSFISCLWYSITLFVIWILVMISVHVVYDYLSLTWFLFLWLSEISLLHILIPESNQTDVCVPCGIAFGSLLCDWSLTDDSSFS